MARSTTSGALPLVFRAAEGLGLLILVGVFLAVGSLMNRKVPRTVRKSPRVSRVHGMTV